MKLDKLIENINFTGNIDCREISGIVHDSRKVKENSLFVVIEGENDDGYKYIKDAIEKGASAIIANGRQVDDMGIPIIHVENTRVAMSKLASNFYGNPSKKMKITGITGTNGKTSTCILASHILNDNKVDNGSLGTLGFGTPSGMMSTGFTTPESIDLQQMLNTLYNGGINNAIMEISSHAISFHRTDDIDVDIALYTNLSEEHLDYHGNMNEYFNVKKKLFTKLESSKTCIVNLDDSYSENIISSTNASIITYSVLNKADIYIMDYDLSINGTVANISVFGEEFKLESNLVGEFNLYNTLAAIAIATQYEIPIGNIINSIKRFMSIPGRMEIVKGIGDNNIIVDYAHTPDAYNKILTTIKNITEKNIITLFGCGGNRDKSKRSKMGKISEKYSEFVFITSDNPRDENINDINKEIVSSMNSNNYLIINSRRDAIIKAIDKLDENTILLVLGKGRDDYEIIDGNTYPHSDIEIIKGYINAI